jgi:hypothetical protein
MGYKVAMVTKLNPVAVSLWLKYFTLDKILVLRLVLSNYLGPSAFPFCKITYHSGRCPAPCRNPVESLRQRFGEHLLATSKSLGRRKL